MPFNGLAASTWSARFRATNSRLAKTATGRQCEYAPFVCSRSAGIFSRSMLATCERPLSLSLTFSSA